MSGANLTFVNGSTNVKMSSLSDHATNGHARAIREQENEKAIATGLTVKPRKVVQEAPTYSAFGAGFKTMRQTEKTALKKLLDIPHRIVAKGRPFKDHIQLEKNNGVKF